MVNLFFLLLYILECRTLNLSFLFDIAGLSSIYLLLTQICAVCLFVYVLSVKKKTKEEIYFVFSFIFYALVLILSNFFANGIFQKCFGLVYPSVSMAFLFLIISSNKIRFKNFISLLSSFYIICLFVHFLDSFSKRGLEDVPFIMGGENHVALTFMLGFIYCIINYVLSGSRLKLIIYFVLLTLSILNVFSASGVIGLLVLTLIISVPYLRNVINSISLFKLFIYYLLCATFFVTIGPFIIENYLSDYIELTLGKDATLTNRTLIWPQVIMEIIQAPIFGHGFSSDENLFLVFVKWSHEPLWFSAHNQVLQTLYNSGIMGLLSFAFLVFICSYYMNRCTHIQFCLFTKAIFLGISISILAESPQLIHLIEILIVSFAFFRVYNQETNHYYNYINSKKNNENINNHTYI